jgi:hypothetical protein
MSGEHQSAGRLRAAGPLTEEAITAIARQAVAVAGLAHDVRDPRALAVALGYKLVWTPRLPNDEPSMVIDRTIYYANHPDDAELTLRVARPLATLILEAWGYDLGAADLLCERLAG